MPSDARFRDGDPPLCPVRPPSQLQNVHIYPRNALSTSFCETQVFGHGQHVAHINFRRLGRCRPSPSSSSPLFSPTHRQSSNVNHHPSALLRLRHESTSFYGRLAGRSLPLMAFRQSFYIADIGRQYSGSPFRLPLFRSVGQLPSHKSVLKSDITFNLSRQHETAVRP